MASDDQAHATPPDWDEWVRAQLAEPEAAALQAHRSAGRRRKLLVGAVAALALVGIGGALYLTARGGSSRPTAAPTPSTSAHASAGTPSPAVSVQVSLPADAPSNLPALLALPPVTAQQAFPDQLVTGTSGAKYQRVDVQTTADCARAVSPELAAIFKQPGNACLHAIAALYTDAQQKSRVTVSVLSFRQTEGMGAAFAMASVDPLTYQAVSLDPPAGSPLPAAAAGGAGVLKRLATVRSVVFVNGQWADAENTDEAGLTAQVDDLLTYVNAKVVAHEEG